MRRTSLNRLSQQLVNYLINKRDLKLTDIARITRVDKSFVSRVKSAEREFSIDHLDMIADYFGVEIGVLFIDMNESPKTTDPKRLKLWEMCNEFIRKADSLSANIKKKLKSNAA